MEEDYEIKGFGGPIRAQLAVLTRTAVKLSGACTHQNNILMKLIANNPELVGDLLEAQNATNEALDLLENMIKKLMSDNDER